MYSFVVFFCFVKLTGNLTDGFLGLSFELTNTEILGWLVYTYTFFIFLVVSLILSTFLFAFAILPAFAQTSLNTGINYGTFTGLGTQDLREGIMRIINVLLSFLGIIAIVIMLWGGFVWLTSGGSEEKVGQAKKIITAGIIGLVIIFISYAIATFVIGQLILATGAEQ